MQSSIQISVTKASFNEDKVVIYTLSITSGQDTWTLTKRYSQFELFATQLKDYFGSTIPQLPKKSYLTFFVGKSDQEIEERRQGLDQFMRQLCSRIEIVNSLIFQEFISFPSNRLSNPQLIDEHKDFLHGIRDFQIVNEDCFFVINSEMSALTRLDAYFTNMKLPWESEKGEVIQIPVGVVECWIKKDQKFEREWAKGYNSQAICLHYSDLVLLVGLDSGSVNYLHFASRYRRYDESIEIEQHLARVMGVYYDGTYIHSIGKDNKYRVLNLEDQSLVADYEPGNFELVYMTVSNRKVYIGDRCGQIFIFDISQGKPKALMNVITTLKFIRGMCVDPIKKYLLAVGYEEGDISVYDVGNEKNVREVAKLKNKSKSREICWSRKRGEIFVGNEDGTITVFNAKSVSPIYIFKAHHEEIMRLIWLDSSEVLVSCSRDKSVKMWKMTWQMQDKAKKEIVESQEEERKEINVEEDDLVAWHK